MKKIITLTLALLLLVLAACGGTPQAEPEAQGNTAQPAKATTEPTIVPTEEPTPEPKEEVTSLYNPGDIAVINAIIDNNGLAWLLEKADPADGSYVPKGWAGDWNSETGHGQYGIIWSENATISVF